MTLLFYNSTVGFYSTEPGTLETLYFCTAFLLGFIVLQFDLPPLIGFILSGFVLNAAGFPLTEAIIVCEKLGQALLLFSIGLKLNLGSLILPQVFIPSVVHVCVSSALMCGFILLCGAIGIPLFVETTDPLTALLLGFAFSFSSTVFAIKVLEERGELQTFHAKISIGILVMQDLFAVIFLAVMTGKAPNIYAVTLVLIPVIQRVMWFILDRSAHGEVLTMFGLSISLVMGYLWFDAMGLKPDLGVLVVGVLLKPHKKSSELSKSMLKIKDLFLVGFFVSTGLRATLSIEAFYVALLFLIVLPFKTMLYYALTNVTYLRARTSLLCAFTLANYSEFGLLVTLELSRKELVDSEWLTVSALAVCITFVLASPLNSRANFIYVKLEDWLLKFEREGRLEDEEEVDLGNAIILILGMGRIGTGVYNSLVRSTYSTKELLGVDDNPEVVAAQTKVHRNVVLADATDPHFWQGHDFSGVQLIVFAFPKFYQCAECLEELESAPFYKDWEGTLASVAKYGDDKLKLREKYNVHILYDVYEEAGSAFATYILEQWRRRRMSLIDVGKLENGFSTVETLPTLHEENEEEEEESKKKLQDSLSGISIT